MNEKMNPDAIRRLLNRSAAELDQDTLAKLRDARELALRRAAERTDSPVRSWIRAHFHGNAFMWRHATAMRFATALMLIGLIGGAGYYWQQMYDNSDESDIAILTDDMPINYYVN